jgi:hypothetical protein
LLNATTGLLVAECVKHVKTVVVRRPNVVDNDQFAIGVGMLALGVLMTIGRRRKWPSR